MQMTLVGSVVFGAGGMGTEGRTTNIRSWYLVARIFEIVQASKYVLCSRTKRRLEVSYRIFNGATVVVVLVVNEC